MTVCPGSNGKECDDDGGGGDDDDELAEVCSVAFPKISTSSLTSLMKLFKSFTNDSGQPWKRSCPAARSAHTRLIRVSGVRFKIFEAVGHTVALRRTELLDPDTAPMNLPSSNLNLTQYITSRDEPSCAPVPDHDRRPTHDKAKQDN